MRRRPDSSIVLLMIVIAIILAIGVFLGVSIILDRPEGEEANTAVTPETLPEASTNIVSVEGETIILDINPEQRPEVVNVSQPAVQVIEEPTATPPPAEGQTDAQTQTTEQVQTDQTQGAGGLPANHVTIISYQVQGGDTLYRIQSTQNTSIALMAKYGISAPDIVVGNILNLPVGDSAACGDWRAYVVLQGDTAFGLSQRFGTTLAELQARNNLDANYSIYETQVICVPRL